MGRSTCRRVVAILVSALALAGLGAVPASAATADGVIAYAYLKPRTLDLVVRTVDPVTGTHTQRIVGGSAPTWSPDGTRFAFITMWNKIAIHNADGSITRTGVPAWGWQSWTGANMDWSPDGRFLAYGYQNQVWVMNTTPPYAPHEVSPGIGVAPSWSPDSTRILYSGGPGANADLYVMNSDGTDNVDLTNTPGTDEERPDWSPDGTSIAYIATGPDSQGLYVSSSDGSNVRYVAYTAYFCCGAPSWSPTGNRIAFIAEYQSKAELMLVNSDGTNERPLASYALDPAWQAVP